MSTALFPKKPEPSKTPICPACNNRGLTKPDGSPFASVAEMPSTREGSGNMTFRQWFTETRPCHFCRFGDGDLAVRKSWINELNQPDPHNTPRPCEPEEILL